MFRNTDPIWNTRYYKNKYDFNVFDTKRNLEYEAIN